MDETARLINPAWKGTLMFLTGMLEKKEAVTLVKELSTNFLDAKNSNYPESLDFIVHCAWENEHTKHLVGEATESLKWGASLSKKPLMYLGIPLLVLSIALSYYLWENIIPRSAEVTTKYTGIPPKEADTKYILHLQKDLQEKIQAVRLEAELYWRIVKKTFSHSWTVLSEEAKVNDKYADKARLNSPQLQQQNDIFQMNAKLLASGKKECEEVIFSPELIECFRYYAFNKDNKIVELGYEEGFRPKRVEALSAPLLGYTHIEKKLVWRLKAEECLGAYLTGGGKVILEKDWYQFWEFKYDNDEDGSAAAKVLKSFCSKKLEDFAEEEPSFPTFRTASQDQELSKLLSRERADCDQIDYSSTLIECIKQYLIDNDGMVLESDFRILPPGSDCDDECDEQYALVWNIGSEECQRVYDAGAGVVIMELKDGRVWEFKYYYENSYGEEGESDIEKVVKGLQRFCGGP